MIFKKIKVPYNVVITTVDLFEGVQYIPNTEIVDDTKPEGAIKGIQKVVYTGDSVRVCKEGDYVLIDPKNYLRVRSNPNQLAGENDRVVSQEPYYDFKIIDINGKPYLYLVEADIDFAASPSSVELEVGD